MTKTLIRDNSITTLENLIHPDASEPGVPQRGYNFNKGDRRFVDLERAIRHADAEAIRTGVRQVVRVDPGPHFVGNFHLVQAVGS